MKQEHYLIQMSRKLSCEQFENHDKHLGLARLWFEMLEMTIGEIAMGIAKRHINPFTFGINPCNELTFAENEVRINAVDAVLFLKGPSMQTLMDQISEATNRDVSIEWVMKAIRVKAKSYTRHSGGRKSFIPKRGETRAEMLQKTILSILKKGNKTTTEITRELNAQIYENLSRATIADHVQALRRDKKISIITKYSGGNIFKYGS